MEDQGIERTLVIIKPEGMEDHKLFRDVLTRLDEIEGIEFIAATMYTCETPRDKKIAATYKEHEGKDFYEWFFPYFAGKQIHIAVYEGENAIEKVKELCGPTDPAAAREEAPDSLRALSDDDLTRSIEEKRMVRNIVHRSDNRDAARYEIGIWFPRLKCDE